MPDITHTVTEQLTEEEARIWAKLEPERELTESAQARIKACRKWVAENPEYPDGTIAYVLTDRGVHLTARMSKGCWTALNWYAAYNDSYLSNVVRVEHVLHTPPTTRDHLHAIGFDDEMIADVAMTRSSILSGVANVGALRQACREAEGFSLTCPQQTCSM